MEFRTIISIPVSENKINFHTKTLFIGSCFTENIGNKLQSVKLPILINPFGILYNPLSIANTLEKLLNSKPYSENDLFLQNDLWHSFDHHGRFSSADKNTCLSKINSSLQKAENFLLESSYLFITFGTSYIYERKDNAQCVANCHKMPKDFFTRRLLNREEIKKRINSVLNKIKKQNTGIKFIFTVSPVRHIKDGLHKNQISKANLLLAIDELISKRKDCSYFPSYEIAMDDLRDYRFYKEDMIHLNNSALQYIWERFSNTYFNKNTLEIIKKIEKINSGLEHRPLHPETKEHKNFIKSLNLQIEKLKKEHPEIKF